MTPTPDSACRLRVAFYGRTASGAEATTHTAIALQYEDCRRVLPPSAITAVFYDIGSDPTACLPGPLTGDGRSLDGDGGLDDLLTEARIGARRFDRLITSSPQVLTRDAERGSRLMDDLDRAGIEYLLPVGDTVQRVSGLHLAIMRLVVAGCTEMRSRAGWRGRPR
jgi:hypothetical protein